MQYRSIADLNATIVTELHRLPQDIDLVVGIPRSGLIAATLIALVTNTRLADLDGYLEGRSYSFGRTKTASMRDAEGSARNVLIIDDSINSGASMQEARARVAAAAPGDRVTYAAVYGSKENHPEADLVLERVTWPRLFQWNFMHHKLLEKCCIDIDGVLCRDPTREQNDDGPAYRAFLKSAQPLYTFTRPLGTLVTSRLEKYRPETEDWLAARGVAYHRLEMLDLPSAEERRRRKAHAGFKAQVFRQSDTILFIESEERQAAEIAWASGKPVLSLETHRLHARGGLGLEGHEVYSDPSNPAWKAVKWAGRRVLGQERFDSLRERVKIERH